VEEEERGGGGRERVREGRGWKGGEYVGWGGGRGKEGGGAGRV